MMQRFRSRPLVAALVILSLGLFALLVLTLDAGADRDEVDTAAEPEPEVAATSLPTPASTESPAPTALAAIATAIPPAPAAWTLQFVRTGGFAGLNQQLVVDDQGRLAVRDLRQGREATATMSASDLAELARLTENASFPAQASNQTRPCADCFNYSLTFRSGGTDYAITANNLGLDIRLQPLVEVLTSIAERTLRS